MTILLNSRVKEKRRVLQFTEAIDGLMLGDASIPKSRSPYFTFAQAGMKREKFVLYVKELLENSGFSCKLDQKVRRSDGLFVSTIWTPVSDFWRKQRKRFYPLGKKVIPRDVEVTPTSMLMLYLCDGSIGWTNGYPGIKGGPYVKGSSSWVELALCSFSNTEVSRLGDDLVRKALIDKYSIKKNGCLAVRGGNHSTEAFFRYVCRGGRIPLLMAYKFRGYEKYMGVYK